MSGLFLLSLKTLVLSLPATVAWLAIRRVFLSRSANVWLYAATAVLVIAACVFLTPWVFGRAPAHPFAIGLSLLSPGIWLILVIFCGPGAENAYQGVPADAAEHPPETDVFTHVPPLVLGTQDRRESPVAMFRHRPVSTPVAPVPAPANPLRSVMDAARAMRANPTSEARRPKALPAPTPPVPEMPFLRS